MTRAYPPNIPASPMLGSHAPLVRQAPGSLGASPAGPTHMRGGGVARAIVLPNLPSSHPYKKDKKEGEIGYGSLNRTSGTWEVAP